MGAEGAMKKHGVCSALRLSSSSGTNVSRSGKKYNIALKSDGKSRYYPGIVKKLWEKKKLLEDLQSTFDMDEPSDDTCREQWSPVTQPYTDERITEPARTDRKRKENSQHFAVTKIQCTEDAISHSPMVLLNEIRPKREKGTSCESNLSGKENPTAIRSRANERMKSGQRPSQSGSDVSVENKESNPCFGKTSCMTLQSSELSHTNDSSQGVSSVLATCDDFTPPRFSSLDELFQDYFRRSRNSGSGNASSISTPIPPSGDFNSSDSPSSSSSDDITLSPSIPSQRRVSSPPQLTAIEYLRPNNDNQGSDSDHSSSHTVLTSPICQSAGDAMSWLRQRRGKDTCQPKLRLYEGYDAFLTQRQLNEAIEFSNSTRGKPQTNLVRRLLRVFFPDDVLAVSKAMTIDRQWQNSGHRGLDSEITGAIKAFVREKCQVERLSIPIFNDIINDECAQARRRNKRREEKLPRHDSS
ncbi:uncharacterized protein [Ptychodera flava]|uniref:uncharacterized protein isoform X2 n=1 Tax=Ptychodera flava TaxID=63121 RepID=UPI003969C719